jgi:hypothetical protein
MSEYELPDNMADMEVPAIPPSQADGSIDLPDGVSKADDGITLEPTDTASEDFGALEKTPESWVPIDLDKARADLDALYDQTESSDSNGAAAEDANKPPYDDETEEGVDEEGTRGPPDTPDTSVGAEDSDDIERSAAQAESAKLVAAIGRFSHGPESMPLRVDNDDTTIATSLATAGDKLEDIGLTPETVIGRKATLEREFDDFGIYAAIETEVLNEEVIPLVEELDEAIGKALTPIARLNITAWPKSNQPDASYDKTDRSVAQPSTAVTVWVGRGLQSNTYVDMYAMDRESGERAESFLSTFGLRNVEILTPDQGEYDDIYISNTRSEVLAHMNRFVRSIFG